MLELGREQRLGSRWVHLGGQRACWARRREGPEAAVAAGQALMEAAGAVFATSWTWGFRSFRECEDVVAGVGAAFAVLVADGTSTTSLMALTVEVRKTDAGGTATAVVPLSTRTACSTLTGASGWEADRRWACRAGHAVVIGQMPASLTVGCGKRLGESPIGSWSPWP